MPREARLRAAGIPWHVRQRGNNGMPIFADDSDRELYEGLLAELAPRTGCHVHAYAFMPNHSHLLVTPDTLDSVPHLMKALGERYVQSFNRRHTRYGTLWEGRYRSCLVETDRYLLTCYRYIEMNPVRGRLCSSPGQFRWSSYAANARGKASLIVDPHPLYLQLGTHQADRLIAYRRLFDTPLTDEEINRIRDALDSGFALATPEFVRELESDLKRKAGRRKPGRPPRPMPVSGDLFGDELSVKMK